MFQFLRRHSRFGLRTLFVLLTLSCVFSGTFVTRVWRQREAVAWARRYGQVQYDFEKPRFAPDWLHSLLGIDFFARPISVRLLDVPDLGTLADLPALERVEVRAPHLKDWRPLERLSRLKELHLGAERIDTITPLRLPRLEIVSVFNVNLGASHPFADCPSLRMLSLPETKVADLEFVRAWPQLSALNIAGPVEDLSPLRACPQLEHLSLKEALVRDLRPLGELPKLQALVLRRWNVEDFVPPTQFAAVTNFGLEEGPVDGLKLVEQMPNLQELQTARIPARDLEPLRHCPRIFSLGISHSDVRDLGPLEALPALQEFHARNMELDDLTPLEGLPSLRTLVLNGSTVRDPTPLTRLSGLRVLYAPRSLNTPETRVRLMTALPQCGVIFE